jgi:hypothetical protein
VHLNSLQPAAAQGCGEYISLNVCWHADRHQAAGDDDACDWSVSFRFCWLSDGWKQQGKAEKAQLIHREKP